MNLLKKKGTHEGTNQMQEKNSTESLNLSKLQSIVANYLHTDKQLRDDDFRLYAAVCTGHYGVSKSASFVDVMQNHVALGIPPFVSVVRVRQKLQHSNPEMYGSNKYTKRKRAEAEAEFFKYSKGID